MLETRRDLSPLLAPFPREAQYLLPAIERVQAELGYLPPWALEAVAIHLRVTLNEVYGVATHYPELRLEQPGRRVVRVCTGLSCRLNGADQLLRGLEQRLGIAVGSVTPDGELGLEQTHCAFLCTVAPIVELDDQSFAVRDPEHGLSLVSDLLSPGGRS
jgi:NADH:ubiquinone oxidoreductase subunit E